MQETCSTCDKPRWARGYCKGHYEQWRSENLAPSSLCSLEDCGGTHYGKGYCRPHYMRWKQHGDAEWVAPPKKNTLDCTQEGCTEKQRAGGLCYAHWDNVRRAGLKTQIEGTRTCETCRAEKAVERFYAGERKCKDCDGYKQLKYTYGLTPEAYNTMLERQSGVCAICGGVNANGKRLAVDHDHRCCSTKKTCGKCVRGLLCDSCNKGIGALQDSPQVLASAQAYLESYALT